MNRGENLEAGLQQGMVGGVLAESSQIREQRVGEVKRGEARQGRFEIRCMGPQNDRPRTVSLGFLIFRIEATMPS
jgi:hypothetical protein